MGLENPVEYVMDLYYIMESEYEMCSSMTREQTKIYVDFINSQNDWREENQSELIRRLLQWIDCQTTVSDCDIDNAF